MLENDSTLDLEKKLKNVIPGEPCLDLLAYPPETRIYFTQISELDLDEFHNYSIDERLYEFFEFEPVKSMSDTIAYYEKMKHRMNVECSHHYWFVRSKDTNNLIGSASLANIDFQRNSVEWGQGVNPEYWGQNYNIEIHEILKHYVFDALRFNRLYGQTMITNARAIAGVKASGCNFEGIARQFYKKGPDYIDAWSYSMLAEEYFEKTELVRKESLEVKLEDIVELVSSELESEKISEDTSMENCRLWDSMSHINIIMAIESRYSLKVKPNEYATLTSIVEIFNYLIGE